MPACVDRALNTFQMDDKDLNTNRICKKSKLISKIHDASVSYPPIYESLLDDLPVHHLPGKVLTAIRYGIFILKIISKYLPVG